MAECKIGAPPYNYHNFWSLLFNILLISQQLHPGRGQMVALVMVNNHNYGLLGQLTTSHQIIIKTIFIFLFPSVSEAVLEVHWIFVSYSGFVIVTVSLVWMFRFRGLLGSWIWNLWWLNHVLFLWMSMSVICVFVTLSNCNTFYHLLLLLHSRPGAKTILPTMTLNKIIIMF